MLLPLPLAGAYDYRPRAFPGLAPGDYVRVPLGPRTVSGVVWDQRPDGGAPVAEAKLRDVEARIDLPPMPENLRRLRKSKAAGVIAAGRPATQMQGFAEHLSEAEI